MHWDVVKDLTRTVTDMAKQNLMYFFVGSVRVMFEFALVAAAVVVAISLMTGISVKSFFDPFESQYPASSSRGSSSPYGGRRITINRAVKDHMDKAGLFHSACFDMNRKNDREFLVCIGRAGCDKAEKTGTVKMAPADEILRTDPGMMKALDVTQVVISHVARQLGTTDLPTIMSKLATLGLACDTYLAK